MTAARDPYDAALDPGSGVPIVPVSEIACPYDPAVSAAECCGTTATDCCDGPKPSCATSIGYDANGDPDVCVCAMGHGCNTYAVPPDPDPEPTSVTDEWTRQDDNDTSAAVTNG